MGTNRIVVLLFSLSLPLTNSQALGGFGNDQVFQKFGRWLGFGWSDGYHADQCVCTVGCCNRWHSTKAHVVTEFYPQVISEESISAAHEMPYPQARPSTENDVGPYQSEPPAQTEPPAAIPSALRLVPPEPNYKITF